MIHPDVEAAVVEIVETTVGDGTACVRLQDCLLYTSDAADDLLTV